MHNPTVWRRAKRLGSAAILALRWSCLWLGGTFIPHCQPCLWAADAEAGPRSDAKPGIRHIDLIHFSHTDVGFTDHPDVCREMQKRYLDIAIDAVLATRDKPPEARFCWTAEATLSVNDWWQSASAERREDFLKAVDSGQLCVSALAMNNMPLLSREEWHKMVHWLPEDLWRRVRPEVALQDDVNGFPRAGAMELLDRGIHRLFTGINEDNGGAPFKRPSAFWWKMPDGRRLFVYLSFAYSAGHSFFDPVEWRRGPVPQAGDTRYRPPRAGDFLGSDEASVRKAHGHLLERIRGLEAHGYRYPVLLLSTTNQWRIDNDPPFPPLAEFVAAWNRLKLEPTLRLTTAAVAMKRLEDEIGGQIPEYQGEWTDWWANGAASAPREVAASRVAKRLLQAADSPLWGPWTDGGRRIVDQSLRDLCLFDEHTWGGSDSVAMPYSLDTQGQFNRKASLAYRPMAFAEWLLGQRVRSRLATEGEGVYVANSSPLAWSGWVRMPRFALRDEFQFARGPRDRRQGEAVFRERLSAVHAAAKSKRSEPREHVRDVRRQLPGADGEVLGRAVARPEHPQAAAEHQGGRRGFAAAGSAADGDSGSAWLAHRDHVAGHDQTAVPARTGRLRGRAGERICPALGGEENLLHDRCHAAGEAAQRSPSKRPPRRPRSRRPSATIRTPWYTRNRSIIPGCFGPPANWKCGRASRGRGLRCVSIGFRRNRPRSSTSSSRCRAKACCRRLRAAACPSRPSAINCPARAATISPSTAGSILRRRPAIGFG